MKKRLLISVLLSTVISTAAFASAIFDDSVQSDAGNVQAKQELLLKKTNKPMSSTANLLSEQQGSMMKVNLSCGLRPLPPLGCQVGACMCDQNGNNCQWTFICR